MFMHQFPSGFPENIRPEPIPDILEFNIIRKYNLWLSDASLLKWQAYLQEPKVSADHVYKLSNEYDDYTKVHKGF